MSIKREDIDDRRQLLIRPRIDENGKVRFIDPCCEYMPGNLFHKVIEATSNIEKEWNDKISTKKI